MEKIICDNCNAEVSEYDEVCPNCGMDFEENTAPCCPKCYGILENGICPKCTSGKSNKYNKRTKNVDTSFDEISPIEEEQYISSNLEHDEMLCQECNYEIYDNDIFCPKCGADNINYIPKINKNINSFFAASKVIWIITIILTTIFCVIGSFSAVDEDGYLKADGLFYAIYGAVILIDGYLVSNIFNWMGLMLYSNTRKNNK